MKTAVVVFPGSNCDLDVVNAVRDTLQTEVLTVWHDSSELPGNTDLVIFPGGFSYGDYLRCGAMASKSRIMDPIRKHAENGLPLLGICNGFQALIKVGLVPYGEIRPMRDNSPTLTFNDIGRHQSRIVHTRVASNLSPWMSGVNTGDVISVAISHGEGKFVCSKEEMQTLSANGQIATQYVNLAGDATYDINFNPNGSYNAVEGITSPDGRVLGKMGHNERYTTNTFKNVEGNFDSKIFKSGVNYFK